MFRYLCLTALSLCTFMPWGHAQSGRVPTHAAAAAALAQAPHHPDRLIVQFKPEADEIAKQAAHGRADTRVHKKLKKVPGLEVRQLNGRNNLAETIAAYEATGLVEYAEPDYLVQASRAPNDPAYTTSKLWHLHNVGQSGGKVNADMNAPEAWETRMISDTVVAVIDTGIRYTHEDLQGNMWRNPNEIPGNRVDDDGNGYVDDVFGINAINGSGNPRDDDGHGTHVAGTIGAVGNNSKGTSGVAWTVKLMACKFLDAQGNGYTSDAVEAIDYARSKGAKIVNNSWSGGGYSNALYDAINRARSAGMIFVAAAGNSSANNDANAVYPANYPLDNIIAVAATDRRDQLASFSNYGATRVELGAPGDEIYSTYSVSDSSYQVLSGTSMAAPQVAGALALLRTQFPSDTRMQLITRLRTSVDPLPSLAGKTAWGGRLNLQRALHPNPGNDDFASAAEGVGDSIRVQGASFGATQEPAEPVHAGKPGGRSIWWKWTPAASGIAGAHTTGSNFNTLLAIYTGDEVGQLTLVAENNNKSSTVLTSHVKFPCVGGRTYYFAVDGVAGAQGKVVLTVNGPPSGEANNAFTLRTKLSGAAFTVPGANVEANKEAWEPNHAGNTGGKSVWWKWTAPSSGYFTLDTFGSDFDTLLGVYTGASLGSLKFVASNDEADTSTHQSRVRFYAAAGRVYHIAVDGYQGASGAIRLKGRYQ